MGFVKYCWFEDLGFEYPLLIVLDILNLLEKTTFTNYEHNIGLHPLYKSIDIIPRVGTGVLPPPLNVLVKKFVSSERATKVTL